MKLTENELIELYDLIYPKSLETDENLKALDMKEILDGEDTIILYIDEAKTLAKWMYNKGYWC